MAALGSFRAAFWRPGPSQASILGHFGGPKPHFLDAASCPQACNEKQAREAFRIGKTNTKHMSALQRAMQKTSKDRSFSLLNSARCQERSEMTCWSAQGSIWEGFGTSRASLGRLLGILGALLVALGRSLDASWTHLGCSWAPLGCQVLSKMGSGSIFHRFWLHFGRAEAGFARALAVFFFHFWTWCWNCCQKPLLAFTLCFSFPHCSAAVRAQHMELEPSWSFWPPDLRHLAPKNDLK